MTAMPTIRFTNDDFFSDQVDIPIETGKLFHFLDAMYRGLPCSYNDYLDALQEHQEAVEKLDVRDVEFKDIRVRWTNDSGSLVVRAVGTKPWSPEKIAEFKGAMDAEKTEIDQLRALIRKHPAKAVDALGYLLEEAKHHATDIAPTEGA